MDAVVETTPETDPLTGLLLRGSLAEWLDQQPWGPGAPELAVLAIEVSRFGTVNDSIGDRLGDRVIRTVARRLTKLFPDAPAVGRLHGDHFGVVLPAQADAEAEACRVLDFAQRPLAIGGEVVVLGIRVGVADASSCVESAHELLHAAEVALHRAHGTPGEVSRFDGDMIEQARAQHRIENDLRLSLVRNSASLHRAVANEEFALLYQPIVSIRTGRVHACEALLRWKHPDRGPVSPAEFIPVAERLSLMDVLGGWVVRRACRDAADWPEGPDGHRPAVSVNISPVQFVQGDLLVSAVSTALEESGIEPHRLKLEVTESFSVRDDMAHHLARLHELGCRIAMDDFGTGYSSVAQLCELPLDDVKVDRSFVRDLAGDDPLLADRAERLTTAVFALADALDLDSIVEGIETNEQIEIIRRLGGDLVQGYVFARPMPLEDAVAFLREPPLGGDRDD